MKAIYPHDASTSVSLFRFENEQGHMEFWPRYKDLACAECGKIDEDKALQRGLEEKILFSVKRDIFGSFEDLYIVNDRVRSIFDSVCADIAYYYFPSVSGYYVAMPRVVYHPQVNDKAFQIYGRCATCRRYSTIGWGSGTPSIPNDVPVGAIHFEHGHGIGLLMYAAEHVIALLSNAQPKLKLVVFLPLGGSRPLVGATPPS